MRACARTRLPLVFSCAAAPQLVCWWAENILDGWRQRTPLLPGLLRAAPHLRVETCPGHQWLLGCSHCAVPRFLKNRARASHASPGSALLWCRGAVRMSVCWPELVVLDPLASKRQCKQRALVTCGCCLGLPLQKATTRLGPRGVGGLKCKAAPLALR